MKSIRIWFHDGGTTSFYGDYRIAKTENFTILSNSGAIHTMQTRDIKEIRVGAEEKKLCSCRICRRKTCEC